MSGEKETQIVYLGFPWCYRHFGCILLLDYVCLPIGGAHTPRASIRTTLPIPASWSTQQHHPTDNIHNGAGKLDHCNQGRQGYLTQLTDNIATMGHVDAIQAPRQQQKKQVAGKTDPCASLIYGFATVNLNDSLIARQFTIVHQASM
jgi:hypothetical protein